MALGDLVQFARQGLLLAVVVSLPVLGAALVTSFVVSLVQSATQVTDPAVAHLPRLLVVAAVLVALGPWMGTEVVAFATRAFQFAP